MPSLDKAATSSPAPPPLSTSSLAGTKRDISVTWASRTALAFSTSSGGPSTLIVPSSWKTMWTSGRPWKMYLCSQAGQGRHRAGQHRVHHAVHIFVHLQGRGSRADDGVQDASMIVRKDEDDSNGSGDLARSSFSWAPRRVMVLLSSLMGGISTKTPISARISLIRSRNGAGTSSPQPAEMAL